MVAPVPEAHLSFIEVRTERLPSSLILKWMIFASCPPSSMTALTSGWLCSTARTTAFTSCTKRALIVGAMREAPEPVM